MNDIPCPSCSTPLDESELCWHDRDPICLNCCASGEHSWRESDYDPREVA